jgi:cytochrome c oxidase assembly protein Cox11
MNGSLFFVLHVKHCALSIVLFSSSAFTCLFKIFYFVCREIIVQFNADVADGMPWKFIPTQREVIIWD